MSRLRGRRAAGPGAEPGTGEAVSQGEGWTVRQVAGTEAKKTYRCPGCIQTIPAGVAHVVVWPTHPGAEERRHWHQACWNAGDRSSAGTKGPRTTASVVRRH
ncbi:hypothetical protein [Streptomyces sp. LUP30]|uniref:hypothetical protein n=1 Tax=Streptomyces sp. LUP30 TaxID=1890285 RepID=UPI0008517136|nr:hypothetical protein [Streptomyces sp. LUP30]